MYRRLLVSPPSRPSQKPPRHPQPHISAGDPAEIRIFREIRRRKVYTLDALFFPESALFSLALLMDLFSSAVIFLRVLVGFSASTLHRGHERSLRDAYQEMIMNTMRDHIGSDRSDRCVKDHDEDAADHTAAESLAPADW